MTISYFDSISPCIDCRHCWSHRGCSLDDTMTEVYPFMEDCDNIVLASPIWFSELSGPLLNMASRLAQYYYASKYFRKDEIVLKKKNGVLVLAGAEKGTEEKASATAHTLFKHMNALPCVAKIFALNTNVVPAAKDEEALAQARAAAVLLNELYGENC